MRILTVKRNKTIVGCAAKMKLYIQDENGDTIINGANCKKLGALKNGELQTFEISNEETVIYVIADKLSKGICNEFIRIPAGEEDIFVSGQNRFNPANGNAFRFDSNNTEEVLANRKRSAKKGIIILICAFIVGFIIGYFVIDAILDSAFDSDGFAEQDTKVFTSGEMQMTLPENFVETDVPGYTVGYSTDNVVVYVLKEGKSHFDHGLSLEDYSLLVAENNNISDDKLQYKDTYSLFEYDFTNPDNDITYHYYVTIHESDEAFWIIQFSTYSDEFEEYRPYVLEWVDSIKFDFSR